MSWQSTKVASQQYSIPQIFNYAKIRNSYKEFLLNYKPHEYQSESYLTQIKKLEPNDHLCFKLDHLADFLQYNPDLLRISSQDSYDVPLIIFLFNTSRAISLLYEAVESIRNEQGNNRHLASNEAGLNYYADSNMSEDSLVEHINRIKISDIYNCPSVPVQHKTDFEIHVIPFENSELNNIHDLNAEHIGRLIKVTGLVTRVSVVRPRLVVAGYICESCGNKQYDFVMHESYTLLRVCSSEVCIAAKKKGTLHFSPKHSRFSRRQIVTMQELPNDTPLGSLPRSIQLIMYNSFTNQLRPGQPVLISGIYLSDTNIRAKRQSSVQAVNCSILVTYIDNNLPSLKIKSNPNNLDNDVVTADEEETDEQIVERIRRESPGFELYKRLCCSFAPSIYGNHDVKACLLLQLIGGSNADYSGSLKIRSDIHILLVGDPGIAKSQLLKRSAALAPISRFTCGSGASGVGLSAAVVRDPTTQELSLEGGAIVLADRGICCIDEFDKMSENDRTAIHEVMEQQTVSISKAGIVATLNARTSILAAANPISGRYNISKTAIENIGLPAALLSRFDIVFLMLDTFGNTNNDFAMANHILNLHVVKNTEYATFENQMYKILTNREFQVIIKAIKKVNPLLPPDLIETISVYYAQTRQEARNKNSDVHEMSYITPRTLLATIRLSQALAKIRFADTVSQQDFSEAVRLLDASKASIALRKNFLQNKYNVEQFNSVNFIKKSAPELADSDGWIDFDAFIKLASLNDVQHVETIIDTLVQSGDAIWDSIARQKFKLLN